MHVTSNFTHSPLTIVLVADDMPENLEVLGNLLLGAGYRVKAANSGRAALRYAAEEPRPDLILLDVMMPEMDGYEVLARLGQNPVTQHIPVVFLTALGDPRDEAHGLRLGAADYITKPIRPEVVLARVVTQLDAKRARDWLKNQNACLEAEVARRMVENELVQAAGIRALAHLAEIRDPETGSHLRRTQRYMALLAEQIKTHPRFATLLTDRYRALLARSAPLHDIGKVGIPDYILQKPGQLTPEEREIMQTHAALGAMAIELAEQDCEQPLEFLALAKEIARWHHERWDGGGYPDGLSGEAIPLSARLMALADVFDALTSSRTYKQAFPFEAARAIVADGRGGHFDPDIVDAFLAAFDEFAAIARRYRDGG
ncbi:response regulator [Methylomagnum sp.]